MMKELPTKLYEEIYKETQDLTLAGSYRPALRNLLGHLSNYPNNEKILLLAKVVLHSALGRQAVRNAGNDSNQLTNDLLEDTRLDGLFYQCEHPGCYTYFLPAHTFAQELGINKISVATSSGGQCTECGKIFCKKHLHSEVLSDTGFTLAKLTCQACGGKVGAINRSPNGRKPRQIPHFEGTLKCILLYRIGLIPPDKEFVDAIFHKFCPQLSKLNSDFTVLKKASNSIASSRENYLSDLLQYNSAFRNEKKYTIKPFDGKYEESEFFLALVIEKEKEQEIELLKNTTDLELMQKAEGATVKEHVLDYALQLLMRGNYSAANRYLLKAHSLDENWFVNLTFSKDAADHIRVIDSLGFLQEEFDINFDKGRYSKCLELAQRQIKLAPKYATAYSNLGKCYYKIQDYKQGERNLQKALQIDPFLLEARDFMLFLYSLSGEEEKVISLTTKGLIEGTLAHDVDFLKGMLEFVNVEVRKTLIGKISDQELLAQLAIGYGDIEIQKVAIKMLTSRKHLLKVADKTTNNKLFQIVLTKLGLTKFQYWAIKISRAIGVKTLEGLIDRT